MISLKLSLKRLTLFPAASSRSQRSRRTVSSKVRTALPTMPLFNPPPPPPSKLGRYRQLAPRAAIHVSPIALGGMSIGYKWADHGFGAMDTESSFKLLDAYYEAGGNFIDTASN